MAQAARAEEQPVTVASLAAMPIRVEVSEAMQWNREENTLRMVTTLCVYDIPDGRKKARMLWGPLGVPDNPGASWPEILRLFADVLDEQVRLTAEREEQLECESCHEPITDDAEAFDCPRYSGPVHVGCHPADCRSVECAEALSDPTGD